LDEKTPAFLLAVVAAGYVALHLCHFTKRRWDALEWERNLLEATILGLFFFLLGRVLVGYLGDNLLIQPVAHYLQGIIPFPFARSLILTFLLGLSIGCFARWCYVDQMAVAFVVKRYGGELLKILWSAGRSRRPLMLTMKSGKVYVGIVTSSPGVSTIEKYVVLQPTISGYRQLWTQRVRFTTTYEDVYAELKKQGREVPFGLVLPLDQIASANHFDLAVFLDYFNKQPSSPSLKSRP